MSKMKKVKATSHANLMGLIAHGYVIDESSLKFLTYGDFEYEYQFNSLIKEITSGFHLNADYGTNEREGVRGSLEGAVHNLSCILKHVPDNKKQDFIRQVMHGVTIQFLTSGTEEKDYSQNFDYVMNQLISHLAKEGEKISLDYFPDYLSSIMYASGNGKIRENLQDDEIIKNVKDRYKGVEKRLDYLRSKYKEQFEVKDGLLEKVPLYARLRVNLSKYGENEDKSKNEQKVELRNMVKEFDQAGYKLSLELITLLFSYFDNEINDICKKHWNNYNGVENKYQAFNGFISALMANKLEDSETQRETKNLERKDMARKFVSTFSNEDISKMFQTYLKQYHLSMNEQVGFILLLENEKIKQLTSKEIKIPINITQSFRCAYESDKKLATENFETLLQNDVFVGVLEGRNEFGVFVGRYSFVSQYMHDAINQVEQNDEKKNDLIRKLITKHHFDVESFVKDSLSIEGIDKDKLNKFLEKFKGEIDKARGEREKTSKTIKEMADELTKASIGSKFASTNIRKEISSEIEESLLELSKHEDTQPIFKQIITDKTKRGEIVEKFAKTIDNEALQKAKGTRGLVSAIIERLFNIIGMIVGEENLGYIMKGRVTGVVTEFDAKAGFVDKLRQDLVGKNETQQR